MLVSDDGHGVPEHLRSHLFEPFQSTKPDGLGLGLAIAHTIVKDHGGDIRHTSRPSPGAEFEVTLPRHVGGIPLRTITKGVIRERAHRSAARTQT